MGIYIAKTKQGLQELDDYKDFYHHENINDKKTLSIPLKDGEVLTIGASTLECDGDGWLITGDGRGKSEIINTLHKYMTNNKDNLLDESEVKSKPSPKITTSPNIFR